MSLFEIYYRALQHLAPAKNRVLLICAANIVLAFVTIAEPILFGRIIDAISAKSGLTRHSVAVGRPRHLQHRRLCAGRARRRPPGA